MAANHFVNELNALTTATRIFTDEWDNPAEPDNIDQYKVFLMKIVEIEITTENIMKKANEYEKEILKQFKARIRKETK